MFFSLYLTVISSQTVVLFFWWLEFLIMFHLACYVICNVTIVGVFMKLKVSFCCCLKANYYNYFISTFDFKCWNEIIQLFIELELNWSWCCCSVQLKADQHHQHQILISLVWSSSSSLSSLLLLWNQLITLMMLMMKDVTINECCKIHNQLTQILIIIRSNIYIYIFQCWWW